MSKYTPCIRFWYWFNVLWSLPFSHSCLAWIPYCCTPRARPMLPVTSMQLRMKLVPAAFIRSASGVTLPP